MSREVMPGVTGRFYLFMTIVVLFWLIVPFWAVTRFAGPIHGLWIATPFLFVWFVVPKINAWMVKHIGPFGRL